jgi:phosphoglycolate phosphatase
MGDANFVRDVRRMMVVFDLDGTLVDSAHDIAVSANETVTSFGGRSIDLDDIARTVGDGARILMQRALTEAGLDPDTPGALTRFLEIYDQRLLDTTAPYPGTREMLTLLAPRVRMAVLTNKPLAHSERLLAALGLREFFDAVSGGDGPLGRKPDPAGLRALMGASLDAALLVGDSPVDFHTASNAGCAFVWARYGFGAARFANEPPDTPYILDAPRDLVATVDRLAAVMRGA